MDEKSREQQIEEFEQQRKVHVSDWLKSILEAKRCDWCGWEDKLNRRSLCVFCERIKSRLAKANKEDTSDERVLARIKRAESEKQNAMNYGIQLKALMNGTPSGLKR